MGYSLKYQTFSPTTSLQAWIFAGTEYASPLSCLPRFYWHSTLHQHPLTSLFAPPLLTLPSALQTLSSALMAIFSSLLALSSSVLCASDRHGVVIDCFLTLFIGSSYVFLPTKLGRQIESGLKRWRISLSHLVHRRFLVTASLCLNRHPRYAR